MILPSANECFGFPFRRGASDNNKFTATPRTKVLISRSDAERRRIHFMPFPAIYSRVSDQGRILVGTNNKFTRQILSPLPPDPKLALRSTLCVAVVGSDTMGLLRL